MPLAAYDDVMDYLLTRKWVSSENIVAGDLSVINASRRNSNFKVLNGTGPHYFLKQEIRNRPGPHPTFASIGYEAAVYQLLSTIYGDKDVFRCFPKCLAFDSDEQMLILEASAEWENLSDCYSRLGRFSSSIARTLGTTLAGVHKISEPERALVEQLIGAPESPPWVFFLTEPDEWISLNASFGNIELVGIAQQSEELCQSFKDLRCDWQNASFIHGDLKWNNCLVPSGATSKSSVQAIKIVDWELARLGDPCWDIGTVFGEYLDFWMSSIPLSSAHPPDQFLHFARFPLDRMWPAIRAFWSAYHHRMKIPAGELTNWLKRATCFAGIRLVQTAFEQLQIEAALSTRAIFLLQLCANIVTRPLEAAVQLLGLPIDKMAAA